MLIIFTWPALLAGIAAGVLAVLTTLVVPGAVTEVGFATLFGTALAMSSAPLEFAGLPSRVFFIPTWLWGGALFFYGFVTKPSVEGLGAVGVLAAWVTTLWGFRAKLRLKRAVQHADDARAQMTQANDPFDAVVLACKGLRRVTEATAVVRADYRRALALVLGLASDLSIEERAGLAAFDAELQRHEGSADAVALDEPLMRNALELLRQVSERAADGRLTPNMERWQALHASTEPPPSSSP